MATKIRKRFKPESEAHLAKRVKESIALRLSDPHAFFKRLYESGGCGKAYYDAEIAKLRNLQ